jgi:hypothetical protein
MAGNLREGSSSDVTDVLTPLVSMYSPGLSVVDGSDAVFPSVDVTDVLTQW